MLRCLFEFAIVIMVLLFLVWAIGIGLAALLGKRIPVGRDFYRTVISSEFKRTIEPWFYLVLIGLVVLWLWRASYYR